MKCIKGKIYIGGDFKEGFLTFDEKIHDFSTESSDCEFLDFSNSYVVPGFIDAHTHADSGGTQVAYVRQGVTTLVAGNCGSSSQVTNVGAYYDSREGGLGPNYLGLIGHNSLRGAVGLYGTTPTLTQMTNMKYYILEN